MQPLSFALFGFRVVVQPAFLLLVGVGVLFRLESQAPLAGVLGWGAVLFVSILVHELGHAVVARRFGLRVGDIELHGLGGQVSHQRTVPARQLGISLAGPGAGLLLGLTTLAISPLLPQTRLVTDVVADLLLVNIGWSVFNLLPMYPLDGGQALRSVLAMMVGEDTGWRVTAGIGMLLGGALAVLGFQWGGIFLMFIGGMVAWTNVRILQALPAR